MIFEMNLHNEPFELIKSKSKTIEMRINDERRKNLKVGDEIIFTNRLTLEKLKAKVVDLYYFNSFSELYKAFDKNAIGYRDDEEANPSDMDLYYTKEQQEKYGVVAIKIEI